MMPFSPSTSTGLVQPNSRMLAAICATWASEWVRGLRAYGISSPSGRQAIARSSILRSSQELRARSYRSRGDAGWLRERQPFRPDSARSLCVSEAAAYVARTGTSRTAHGGGAHGKRPDARSQRGTPPWGRALSAPHPDLVRPDRDCGPLGARGHRLSQAGRRRAAHRACPVGRVVPVRRGAKPAAVRQPMGARDQRRARRDRGRPVHRRGRQVPHADQRLLLPAGGTHHLRGLPAHPAPVSAGAGGARAHSPP